MTGAECLRLFVPGAPSDGRGLHAGRLTALSVCPPVEAPSRPVEALAVPVIEADSQRDHTDDRDQHEDGKEDIKNDHRCSFTVVDSGTTAQLMAHHLHTHRSGGLIAGSEIKFYDL
jgi:hypothetical protein